MSLAAWRMNNRYTAAARYTAKVAASMVFFFYIFVSFLNLSMVYYCATMNRIV